MAPDAAQSLHLAGHPPTTAGAVFVSRLSPPECWADSEGGSFRSAAVFMAAGSAEFAPFKLCGFYIVQFLCY
jgi:hypothetical protein